MKPMHPTTRREFMRRMQTGAETGDQLSLLACAHPVCCWLMGWYNSTMVPSGWDDQVFVQV